MFFTLWDIWYAMARDMLNGKENNKSNFVNSIKNFHNDFVTLNLWTYWVKIISTCKYRKYYS